MTRPVVGVLALQGDVREHLVALTAVGADPRAVRRPEELAGLAGIVLAARLDSVQPSSGLGYELDTIAAVVIGGASLSGGVGSIGGTVVGVLIIGVLRNGLNLLGVSPFIQQVVIGVVIALAVATDTWRRRAQ